MKKIILLALALPAIVFAQTYPSPTFNSLTLQNALTPANGGTGATTSTGTGSVVLSNSPFLASPTITGSLNAPGLVSTSDLAAQAANTILANASAVSASPTAVAIPSCSGANNALRWASGSGFSCAGAIALTSSGLNQFAATTSAQLAGVISDETGSGSLVFGTNPTLVGATITSTASISQPTAATSSANQNSPNLSILGNYWNGSSSAGDGWFIQNQLGSGANPTSTLAFNHAGSSNTASVSISNLTVPGSASFATLSASSNNPSLKYLATGTGAVSRTYASKFGDVVSVTDFGADPTGSADSTAAINNAIGAVTSTGGTVYLPGGTYKISSAIVLPATNASVSLIGSGFGTKIVNSSGASFDMITWANPGSGNISQVYATVGNFQISQSGASGSGAEINSQYASSLTLKDILLTGIAVNGDGIKITGNGSVASHDIHIQGISGTSLTGNSVIHMTSTTNDIKVSNVIYEGQFLVKYGFLLDSGLGTVQIQDVHASNFANNVFSAGTNTGPIQCTNCLFDSASTDNTVLNGTTNSTFVNSRFMVAGSGYSSVVLANAVNNQFTNCIFDSGNTAKYAVNETGTSNGNRFNQMTLTGSFATAVASLVGNDTSVRISGQDLVLGSNGSISSGATLYFGSGPANATEGNVQFTVPYGGYIRKVLIQSTNAPGAGQTYTATVRQNNANTSLTAQLSGASAFNTQASGFLFMNEGDQVDVSVVASSGAAASNIRVTLVMNY
ncbi:glycosyl hydrolase family 28-related protein [Burkholderia gladioli]|uniref:glycosyl hydrolase family 28-related protein n=1 Tax=Burkholderia gladioli TaxID=28095 RepID=UPI0016402CBF|nr:glycosyl hydrolase family 28-related protein [Burkholderia gladioli]